MANLPRFQRSQLTIIILVLFLFSTSAFTQGNFWSFSNGPYGGTAADEILVSPKGLVFAANGTDIFRSADNGSTWTHVLHLGYPRAIYSFAINSKGYLFVGDATNMIDFSSDDGTTWSVIHLPGTQFTNALYIANDIVYASNGNSIYTSSDDGKNWNTYTESSLLDNVVGFAPLGNGIAAMHYVLGFPGRSNLLLTTNEGMTWDSISPAYPKYMAKVASDGTNLYATDDSNLYRYDAIQKTFSKLTLPRGSIGDLQVLAGGSLFVTFRGLNLVTDSFIYSRDKGLTFQPFGPGSETVLTLVQGNGGFYIGTLKDGVFRSTDNGATWTTGPYGLPSNINSLISGDGPTLFAAGSGGGMISRDNGATWQQMKGEARGLMYMTKSPDGHIFSPSYDARMPGSIEIKDNGATILHLPFTFQYLDQNGALYDWAQANNTTFTRSTDEGQHWTTIQFPSHQSYPQMKFVTKQNHLFAVSNPTTSGTQLSILWRSTDLGLSWQNITSTAGRIVSGDTADITPIAEGSNGVLYGIGVFYRALTGKQSIFRSTDDGASWAETATRVNGLYFKVVAGGDTAYAISDARDSSIFRSLDNGQSWALLASGLPGGQINDIAMRPDGSVFAATSFGVYRHPPLPNSGVVSGMPGNVAFTLYPNPTNANSTIELSLSKQSNIQVSISDLLGNTIQTPFEGILNTGAHTISLHLQSLHTGSYFCRIREGDVQKTMLLVITRY